MSKQQKELPGINCGFAKPNFWEQLEIKNNNQIPKCIPNNDDNFFDEEYLKILKEYDEKESYVSVRIGDIVTGDVIKITKKEIQLDFGYKDYIYVDIKTPDLRVVQNISIGDKLDVIISDIKENPYEIKGSVTELIKLNVAEKLKDYYKNNTPLKCVAKERIPAGFMLDIDMDDITITAFMPNTLAGVNRLTEEQANYAIGKIQYVMLESLQQERGVYVVSRKKFLQSKIPEYINNLEKDKLYTGTITGHKDFGVFVEFESCLTGMIHKVNLTDEFKEKLKYNRLEAGEEIQFYVRDILKGNKLILSQVIRETLWDDIKVGQVKEGIVKGVKHFGILVMLDDETNGLIQNNYVEKSKTKYKEGDKINVKVISVLKDDRKIFLDIVQE